MNDELENDFDQKGESGHDDFDFSNQRNIYTQIGDPEIKGLYDKYKKGRLDIQPNFQRQFVWDVKKSSQLIESAMLDIPLPVVYFSEKSGGRVDVIDGQQRLTAFFSFIDGKFPDGKDFKLTGLKVFKDFNRKKFSELSDEYQEKISECKIRTITFKQESDKDLKFEVFERLNSGSVKLNDQELRNCMYRGRYNDLLRELSQDKNYTNLMGYSKPHTRMRDVEYVLRFASFYNQTYLRYISPMKKFLNEEMEQRRDISDKDAQSLRNAFKNSVSLIYSLLGNKAFKRFVPGGDDKDPNGHWETKKFNASLFDILMWSFADRDKNVVMNNLDSIKEGLINLMCDQDFIGSILLATSDRRRVERRFDMWKKTLDGILSEQQRQPRCFSYSLKKELHDKNPTCAICGNNISEIDDAAIDHIKQYWVGGKTIPENARLTHRYCNNARSRNEKS